VMRGISCSWVVGCCDKRHASSVPSRPCSPPVGTRVESVSVPPLGASTQRPRLDLTTDHCGARRQTVRAWIVLALVASMVLCKRRGVHDL
jgi:hypothetical protein